MLSDALHFAKQVVFPKPLFEITPSKPDGIYHIPVRFDFPKPDKAASVDSPSKKSSSSRPTVSSSYRSRRRSKTIIKKENAFSAYDVNSPRGKRNVMILEQLNASQDQQQTQKGRHHGPLVTKMQQDKRRLTHSATKENNATGKHIDLPSILPTLSPRHKQLRRPRADVITRSHKKLQRAGSNLSPVVESDIFPLPRQSVKLVHPSTPVRSTATIVPRSISSNTQSFCTAQESPGLQAWASSSGMWYDAGDDSFGSLHGTRESSELCLPLDASPRSNVGLPSPRIADSSMLSIPNSNKSFAFSDTIPQISLTFPTPELLVQSPVLVQPQSGSRLSVVAISSQEASEERPVSPFDETTTKKKNRWSLRWSPRHRNLSFLRRLSGSSESREGLLKRLSKSFSDTNDIIVKPTVLHRARSEHGVERDWSFADIRALRRDSQVAPKTKYRQSWFSGQPTSPRFIAQQDIIIGRETAFVTQVEKRTRKFSVDAVHP